nr:T9SS type A sorting domain-containing protein [Rhodothermaceae bacterium]
LQYSLTQGWNLIATPSCNNIAIFSSSTFPTGAIAEGLSYHYDIGGYKPAFSFSFPRGLLNQGKGYWVYSITNASLSLTCGSGKQAQHEEGTLEDVSNSFGSITLRDSQSGLQTFYFGNTLQRQEEAISYKLPPKGPKGDFDVRYTNDTRLTQQNDAVVRINDAAFPLSVSFNNAPAEKEGVLFIDEMNRAGAVIHTHQITENENIQLFDSSVGYLKVRFVESQKEDLPMQFSLHGNYPNPFNPTTRITFDIPERGDLTLKVVDMLGREVYSNTYLGLEASSNQSLSFDANDLPAGIYVYVLSLQTSNQLLTQSGRMTLLK